MPVERIEPLRIRISKDLDYDLMAPLNDKLPASWVRLPLGRLVFFLLFTNHG